MPDTGFAGGIAKAELARRIKEDKRLDGIAAEFVKMEEERQRAYAARTGKDDQKGPMQNKLLDALFTFGGFQGVNTILDFLIVDPVKGVNQMFADWILKNKKEEGGYINFKEQKPPRIGNVGFYPLHDKEMVLSAQDTKSLRDREMVLSAQEPLNFAKKLYTGGFGTGAGGGNITIVNAPTQPVTNLSQNSTNINQIQVPESALNNERTFRTVAHGQMAHA